MDSKDDTLDFSKKMQLLTLVLNSAEREADRMWGRYQVMLTVNGGLIALLAFKLTQVPLLALIISILGLALSIMWYRITILSYYYERRWFADAQSMIESDEILQEHIRARTSNSRVPRPIKQTSTDFLKGIVILFCLGWIAILATSIYTLISL